MYFNAVQLTTTNYLIGPKKSNRQCPAVLTHNAGCGPIKRAIISLWVYIVKQAGLRYNEYYMKANLEHIKKKALPILLEAGVTRSALFGSYVRGENTQDSDIDILVEVPRGTGLFGLADLEMKLEKALGKKTDLVTYKSLHPLLKDRILAEQVPII